MIKFASTICDGEEGELNLSFPWLFEIAAAVTANMELHENKKGFFVVVLAAKSSTTYRKLKLSSWAHVE